MDVAEPSRQLDETMDCVLRIMHSWRLETQESGDVENVTEFTRELNDCQARAARIAADAFEEFSRAIGGSDEIERLNEEKLKEVFTHQPSMIKVANLLKTSTILIEVISNLIKAIRCTDDIDLSRDSDISDFMRVYGEILFIVDTYGLDKNETE